MFRILILGLSAALLASCETIVEQKYDTVSIRYDPYNYSMAKLHKSADSACIAKGMDGAFSDPIWDEPEVNSSVRWAYMEFECYAG